MLPFKTIAYPGLLNRKLKWFLVYALKYKIKETEKWDGDISAPGEPGEWLYFGDGKGRGVIYIVHNQDDEAVDSYWPMNKEMTVFGFGRLGIEKFMRTTPAQFTVGLTPSTEHAEIRRIIDSAYQPLTVYVGQPDWRQ